jgi:Flp pilus assembly protein TadD
LQRAGKRQEALILLRKFAAESPDAEVCSALGFILFQMDQFEDTVKVLRDAIAFDPRIVKTHVILGAALVRIGEKEKQKPGGKTQALELFRQAVAAEDAALALQKTHAPAHLLRGQALQLMGGRTDDCLRALRDAVLFEPDNSFMHLTLGEALAEAGKIPEALQHLENAVRLAEPNDSRPRLALEKWRPKAKRE